MKEKDVSGLEASPEMDSSTVEKAIQREGKSCQQTMKSRGKKTIEKTGIS